MTLRAEIHAALDGVTPPAPHLPHTALSQIRQETDSRRTRSRWPIALGSAAGLAVVLITALVVGELLLAKQHAGPPTPAVVGSSGGWYEGTLDPGGSSADIRLQNDGRHMVVWRVFNGATTDDADLELAVYTPDGLRYSLGLSTPPRIPDNGGPASSQAGTWKFVVHNLTNRRLAWALELAAVPGTATYPLALGTYEGSVPGLIGTVVPLAAVPGHRSVKVTFANSDTEFFVGVIPGHSPPQQPIGDQVTMTFVVPDGSACCYGVYFGNLSAGVGRHSVPITITYS
jgi:hypothetical protein